MNLQILGEIIVFSGVVWYINKRYNLIEFNKLTRVEFNKFNKPINDTIDYSKMFPIKNVDIDTVILSIVNKETLISLSTVNKYLSNIIISNPFWRLRMEARLGLKTKNMDTNFRFITNVLDNSKSLSDNMYCIMRSHHKHSQEVYELLAENRRYGYLRKYIENKNLEILVIALCRNIFRPPFKPQYDFTEWREFLKESITNLPSDFKESYLKNRTDIMEVKLTVNFNNNNETIMIKCNSPFKLMMLLFEFSRKLQVKTISISGTENNPDILNKWLYKAIERLT